MRIGFYAPLKAPDHGVPSGDRAMARLLLAALRRAGHEVDVISTLRGYLGSPDGAAQERRAAEACREVETLTRRWQREGTAPDILFAYHLYYKAPDLLAHPLSVRFGLPYVTAEASHAGKRAAGPWRDGHGAVETAVRAAAVHFCFTPNDRAGLAELVDPAKLVDLPPFIDASGYDPVPRERDDTPLQLATVAMMRAGDKADSYAFLAAALGRLRHLDWHLTVAGDGPARDLVQRAFAPVADRVTWRGTLPPGAVAELLRGADLFVWPGINEAYGLSYLEAQACGLPAVAIAGHGTPSVILHGQTGMLTSASLDHYAGALEAVMRDGPTRRAMGIAASRFVHRERNLAGAAARLDTGLAMAMGTRA